MESIEGTGRKMLSPDLIRKWLRPELKWCKKSQVLGNIRGKIPRTTAVITSYYFIDPDPVVGKAEPAAARRWPPSVLRIRHFLRARHGAPHWSWKRSVPSRLLPPLGGAVGMSTVQRDRLFTRGSYKAAKGQLELGRSHSATDSQGRGCECIAEEWVWRCQRGSEWDSEAEPRARHRHRGWDGLYTVLRSWDTTLWGHREPPEDLK